MVAQSDFQNDGDSLRRIVANPQACPTILEITFNDQHMRMNGRFPLD